MAVELGVGILSLVTGSYRSDLTVRLRVAGAEAMSTGIRKALGASG